MKTLVILGFAVSAWCGLAVFVFAFNASPYWAIGSAVLAVFLWFVSSREGAALREREEDREYYQHPKV